MASGNFYNNVLRLTLHRMDSCNDIPLTVGLPATCCVTLSAHYALFKCCDAPQDRQE